MTSFAPDDALLAPLNPPQQEAVRRIDGPLLVLAGAGSGKTRVITHRIAWMIRQGIPGSRILGVTFTNRAAREMRDRVRALTGTPDVRLSTFHSFCAAFLREEFPQVGRPPQFTIYDEGDALVLVRRVLDELTLDADHHQPAARRADISAWKNAFVSPEDARRGAEGTVAADAARIYECYDHRLREANACDFDDLLVQTLRLLEDHPEILVRWRQRLTHLLVDEFQDTNQVQYRLVRALAGPAGNLCVTGDQDQSIYAWRGAEVANFDRFLADFPGAAVIKLEQNYRSTGLILGAASTLIAHNHHRIPKRLWTAAGDGEPVRILGFPDDYEEALAVADEIRRLLAAGTDPAEIAVLFRTNALSLPVERVLLQAGIAYQVVGGLEFFARTEVKDVLAWLRFLVNPSDTVSLARALQAPPRGIGDATRTTIEDLARTQARPVGAVLRDRTVFAAFPARARKALESFADLLAQLDGAQTGRLGRVILRILELTGFAARWERQAQKGGALDPWQNIGQLVGLADECDADGTADLASFLGQIALLTDLDRLAEGEAPVSLLTLHASKGLEFENVFIIGVDYGLLPHASARTGPGGEEEERRLLHVGMTRAQRRLVLSYAAARRRFGAVARSGPSPFLDEVGTAGVEHLGDVWSRPPTREAEWAAGARSNPDGDAPAALDFDEDHPFARLRKGTRVRHPHFGVGTVAAVRGRGLGLDQKVVIAFGDEVQRTLILRHAALEILDEDAG